LLSCSRNVAVAAALLAAGLTVAACSGGSSHSSSTSIPASLTATQWASRVCGTVTTWISDLQSSSNDLKSAEKAATSLVQAKTVLQNFLSGAVASTNSMISGIQSAGTPAVQNGRALAQRLVAALQEVRTTFVQVQTQAEELPVDNPTTFLNQAQALGSSLDNAGSQVKSNLNGLSRRYPSSDLNAAFKNQAACQSLTGPSTSSP
jgi:hypothetical protein